MIYRQIPLTEFTAMEAEQARLRQEVADLREAMGLADVDQNMLRIACALRLTPMRARLVHMLYAARGAWVPLNTVLEMIERFGRSRGLSDNLVNVHVHLIRKALGREAIQVSASCYRLSEAGMALVKQALDRNPEAV